LIPWIWVAGGPKNSDAVEPATSALDNRPHQRLSFHEL
jgi:hypothetical protein